jgi:type II secretory pathway predicted ATPase ExeA
MNLLAAHWGFQAQPFGRATPHGSIYRHPGFLEAEKRLLFTTELHGIAALVAEAGCGKSLLLGALAEQLQRQDWTVHYLAHSTLGPFSLVNVLARKVGLAPRRSRGETAMAVADALLEDKSEHLLIIDEAHALPDVTLEDIRLLTIADFDRRSPFLLLLAGQPLLEERLAEPTHYALDQRITMIARLLPLSSDETRDYIHHRLQQAGADNRPVFDDSAIDGIFDASGGVPRRINNLANAALIVAAARNRRIVSAQDIQDARLDRGRLN